MKFSFTAFALTISIFSFGQGYLNAGSNEVEKVKDMQKFMSALSINRNVSSKEANIEGSAYLNEQFINGVVALTNGTNYTDIPLRYNAYNEEIEFSDNNGNRFNINNPENIREVTIGESKFIYTDCKLKKENKKIFAEVLAEGKISLLKHYRIKYLPAKEAESYKAPQPPRFVIAPSEYMIRKSDGYTQIFRNKNELLMLLSDKKEVISVLIKQQKLSINDEKDLATIIGYYNGK